MKRKKRFFGIAVFAAMAALAALAACSSPTDSTPDPDPGPAPVISVTTQPANATVTAGSISGSLSVTAAVTEGAALSYQWYSNTTASNAGGTSLGATAKTRDFTIPATLPEGTYYYFCEVTASGGATPKRSNVATVTVMKAGTPFITIIGQPLGVTVTEGSISGSLSVTASGNGGATITGYQWYRNITANNGDIERITGATLSSFTIPANLTAGEYYYFCEVTASGGAAPVRSDVAKVTVREVTRYPGIEISAGPNANTTVTVGKITGSLSVTAAGIGGAEITGYQWYSNTYDYNSGGTVIDGATEASFTIPDNLTVGRYYYYCMVTASGSTYSITNVAKVTVVSAITITTPPADVTVTAGDITESLSVAATAIEGVSISGYQWYKNYYDSNEYGEPIVGATSASFAIPADLTVGEYYYFCEITASDGTDVSRSDVAVVTVSGIDIDFVITVAESDDHNLVAQSAEAAPNTEKKFSAAGSGWKTYQWYVDGTAEEGAVTADYMFNRPAGVYNLSVVVTNDAGDTWSGSCWVTAK